MWVPYSTAPYLAYIDVNLRNYEPTNISIRYISWLWYCCLNLAIYLRNNRRHKHVLLAWRLGTAARVCISFINSISHSYSGWFSLIVNSATLDSWSISFAQYDSVSEQLMPYVRVEEAEGIPIIRKFLALPNMEPRYVIVVRAVSQKISPPFDFDQGTDG